MNEKSATAVVGMGPELGYGGYWAPFTEVQRKELEQQAMIYKYLVAGLPVPPDLVSPIRHGFEGLPTHIFNHPALGYCSYYGKKFDPEPGRCRRTDGKKWRCSKDAHPDSKYCERHMHRGRNRSRKPVESRPTLQPVLTAIPHSSTGCGSNSGSSRNTPLYSVTNSERSPFGSNVTKLQMGPISYGTNSREFSFSREASARVENICVSSTPVSSTWSLAPSQVSSSSLFKQGSDSQSLDSSSAQQYMSHAFEPMNTNLSKQQQNALYGSDMSSPATMKQEQEHPVHLFFSEWPTTKESWSSLDNDGSNQNAFSSTQLSISTLKGSSDFVSGTPYSNDG